MTNLGARVARLEHAAAPGCIIVWRNTDKTPEQTKVRWKAENPGRAAKLDEPGTVYIVGWSADPRELP